MGTRRAKVKAAILCKEDGSILSSMSPPLVASAKIACAYAGFCQGSGAPVWSFVNVGDGARVRGLCREECQAPRCIAQTFSQSARVRFNGDFVRVFPKMMECALERTLEWDKDGIAC